MPQLVAQNFDDNLVG